MNQNKADDKVTEAEYVIRLKAYEEKIQKKITEWKFTQTDIDALNSINNKKLVTKELNKSEVFHWLIKSNIIWVHELQEYLQNQKIDLNEPFWVAAHSRLGSSHVSIFNKDIDVIDIGGNTAAPDWKCYDYKDYYNPDFKIYNDVCIKADGLKKIELWNYPEEQFPPVYDHDTVYDKNKNLVYITGGLGSGERQKKNITEIYQLNVKTKDIECIDALGESPPCLHNHHTKMWNHDLIEMRDGNILKNGKAIKNLYVWYFNLKTKTWLKQKQEMYHHWLITSSDSGELFLDISKKILKMEDEKLYSSEFVEECKQDIFKYYGYVPDYKIYLNLYRPVKDMYFSEFTDYMDRYPSCACILNRQIYHCFEGYNRIEVAFQNSTSNEFQEFIINDLTSKLKQLSGLDVVVEKVT
ncbi:MULTISPECIES: hypothetical protein [Acinetobacter]|nr:MULTISPECIES: hypothetical protein [Acinetobacter]ELW85330.1 hypothetical protein ACINWC743_0154 [Acinetobacter sp. WC-743]MBJ8427914.1 hypothetical protein [Acinetobacter bereziniae]MBJ8476702.1 hypothetical protein [Acinetobacter bereziniae]